MNFNKKNIYLICAGIMLLTLQFNIRIGNATIDIFSDILAYVLIIAGIWSLNVRNKIFKKARVMAIIGILIAIGGQSLNLIDWGEMANTTNTFVMALGTIFTIYFTYYFEEAISLESQFQEKAALTRSYRITWLAFGALVFVNYIAFMSNVSILAIIMQAIVAISAIYFVSVTISICSHLYMEGIPTKHMDIKQ